MKRLVISCVLSAWILLHAPCGLAAQDYDFSEIDQMLQHSLENIAGLGGGVSLMLWQDGEVIYNKSFVLEGKNFSEKRLVPIASATKWLSAAVIMALIDRGELALDDRAGDAFPSLEGPHAEMTIRQMFSHTAGLPGNINGPHSCVADARHEGGLAGCVDLVLQEALIAAPGTVFSYGGNSMHVVGRMAELAGKPELSSGDAWDALWRELIADPSDMSRTAYDAPLTRIDNPRISGGAWSSGEEYLNFLIMLLQNGVFDGRRVLSEAGIEEMLSDQTNGATIRYSPYQLYGWLDSELPANRYGVGVWRERVDQNGSLREASSQGAFGFSPWIDRDRNLAGVLSVFSGLDAVYPSYYRLKQLIHAAIPLKTTSLPAWDASDLPLSIYPQPAVDDLNIILEYPAKHWYICNLTGAVVHAGLIRARSTDLHIQTTDLPTGIYTLNIFTANSATVIRRLISIQK